MGLACAALAITGCQGDGQRAGGVGGAPLTCPSVESGGSVGSTRATGGALGSAGANGGNGAGGATRAGAPGSAGSMGGAGASGARGGARGEGGAAGAGGARGSAGAAGGSGGSPPGGATGSGTIQLAGNRILDPKGHVVVARGPEDVVASTGQTKDIDEAAALGANAMRMLLTLDAANGMTPSGFDALLGSATAHHMLVWVSLYTWDQSNSYVIASALGGGNFYSLPAPDGAAACSSATPASCYLAVWQRQWLKDLMSKYRSNVIIDAVQEFVAPGSADTEAARVTWATAAKTHVQFFRAQGYANPLEVMANFQGRDLYGIVEYGESIRAVDTAIVSGSAQTMFGWQAYWGTTDQYYPKYQGALLLGRSDGVISGADAIHQFAATRTFPIEIGIDNYAGDTNLDYQAEIDQAAADNMSWLWWSWKNDTVDCPVSGSACQSYVTASSSGFRGAQPLTN